MTRARIFLAIVILTTSVTVRAAEHGHTSTLKWVYPMANGDFILGFDNDTTQCSNGNVPKYMQVTVGQNGVTAEGSKKMYAAVLMALAAKMPVSIAFDDATSSCYINRLTASN